MLNMSINTQQEEIDKLHADLAQKEKNLQQKDKEMNDDMRRFDNFLKELDSKAKQASAKDFEQLRLKAGKEKAMKELFSQIQIAESGLRQHTSQIEDYSSCKQLLDKLSPGEHFEENADKKRVRQRERRRDRIEKRKAAYRQQQEEAKNKMKPSVKSSRRQRQSPAKEPSEPEPNFEDALLTSSDKECSSYFESTDHNILTALQHMEDGNASLDKKVQEQELAYKRRQLNRLKEDK